MLTVLVEKGIVMLGNLKENPRKGPHAYLPIPNGVREKLLGIQSLIERKQQEFEALKVEIKALEKEAGLAVKVTLAPRSDKQ